MAWVNCPHCYEAIMPEPIADGWIACDNCGGQYKPTTPEFHAQLVEAWAEYEREWRRRAKGIP